MQNKQKTKVLFAEADSDFVDILISFLTLPLGGIVRVLKKHYGENAPVFGSLTSLYSGLANLDSVNFWTEGLKDILLHPTNSFGDECLQLKFDISDSLPTEYFICSRRLCAERYGSLSCLSLYYDTVECYYCGTTMKRVVGEKGSQASDGSGGIFTLNTVSFIISDHLRILPNMTGFVQTLRDLGITDTNGAELRNVTFGFNEIMDLLKGSLLSRTPLTDIILNKSQIYESARTKYETGVSLDRIEKKAPSNSKKMNLNVILQKSTNKLLFAQAEDDFVDFLLCFLTIPLGGVEYLLGSNTCLKSIDNLHSSVADLINDKYLASASTKTRLINPSLPPGYIPKNFIFPLNDQSDLVHTSNSRWESMKFSSVKFVRGQGKYLRGPRMYKITDDLTVTPFCMASSISVIESLKIPLSDIKEMELRIGLEEALNILKASLTSTSALTDAMKINPMLMKQPKEEQYC